MAIREIEIEKLNPAVYNPRVQLQPGMPEYENLKKSITEYGNVEPIVWNERTGNVVGGHQRLAILKDIGGFKTLPCSVVDLNPEDEKVLNIALNKIKGRWDYDKLEDLIKELDSELAESAGFNEGELAVLLSDNSDLEGFDFDFGIEEWESDEESQNLMEMNFVISLVFQKKEDAREWVKKEGFGETIKERARTLVLRMD